MFDNFCGQGVGSAVMDFIKSWFISPLNKTGCRYIIVDAVNNYKVLRYYKKNGFEFMFSSDEEGLVPILRIFSGERVSCILN